MVIPLNPWPVTVFDPESGEIRYLGTAILADGGPDSGSTMVFVIGSQSRAGSWEPSEGIEWGDDPT